MGIGDSSCYANGLITLLDGMMEAEKADPADDMEDRDHEE